MLTIPQRRYSLSLSLSPSVLTAGTVTEAVVQFGRERKKGTRLGCAALIQIIFIILYKAGRSLTSSGHSCGAKEF